MNSLILRTAARFLLPLMILFSVYLLLRGHDRPGGGFIGGLVAAAAFALNALAKDPDSSRHLLRVDPRTLIGAGLLCALFSGFVSWPAGAPFLTGRWVEVYIAGSDKIALGTPLLFDLGVYLVVAGVVVLSIVTIMQE